MEVAKSGAADREGPGAARPSRAMRVGALALCAALAAAPAVRAEQPDPPPGMSSAAAAARAILNGPRPVPPVTSNAGMGTAEAPRPERPLPASARPARPLPTAGGIDAAGDGEFTATVADPPPRGTTVPARAPEPRAATTGPAPRPATRGGIDAAGDGEPPPAALSALPAAPAPAPAAPPAPAAATAQPPLTAPLSAPAAVAPAPAQPAILAEGPLAPVAQALAARLAQPDAVSASRKEQEALSLFYAGRQYAPVFVGDGAYNPRGAAVLARLAAAGEDGLDPNDYAQAPLRRGADAQGLAQAELQLAAAALTYARHAQAGRFEPSRISSLVTPTRELPDPAAVLAQLAAAPDANTALAAFNPPHDGYRALKAKLASAGAPPRTTATLVAPGQIIKPGASDPRVPVLRTRLGVSHPRLQDPVYDPALVEAVKAFQESARLKPTGIVGAATIDALNRGTEAVGHDTRADIIANMERWRWLPRDLGAQRVMVNIPEFMVRVYDDGRVVHQTRVIVGKPETPTPLLTQDMRYVVVNPAWNIPPSIARNEMMPLLRSDPSALARRGIQVVRNGSGGYSFRQAPGERNALGRIKFMFPNDHSVYLHDTPSRTLFQNARRAYSHGCIRVQDPFAFGEVVFGMGLPGENWPESRIAKLLGGKERYVNLKQRIPVHLVYFNTFVDSTGKVVVLEDLYGFNAQTKALLGLDGKRRLAEGATGSRR